MIRIAAFALCLLCGGCAFDSMQLDLLRSGVSGVLPGAGEGDLAPYAWKLEFNQLEARLYAVDVPDGTLFADRDGSRIGFDGADVVAGEGLPMAIESFRIDKQGEGVRVHQVPPLGRFRVECQPRRRTIRGWETLCLHRGEETVVPMTQRISEDQDGNIVRIEAVLVPGGRPLTLVKMEGTEE